MRVRRLHDWPATVPEARALQEELRGLVDLSGPGPEEPELVAGVDVGYSPEDDRLVAAVVVLRAGTLEGVEEVAVSGRVRFPYVPGLFAFRELPTLVEALERLTVTPDLLVCDGYGLAHPYRFGLACHLGVLTDLPTIGVGKTAFVGACEPPGPERGAWSAITDGGETIGRALRTRRDTKPVYVSQGHRISLSNACRQVLELAPRYRIPEPIRQADRLSRRDI
ncbi:endonuclease V [Sphaerisporangium sp. NPDC051017]|uniref:endonuclease V n=1 Tax=Sphaerisporangium sp. NPDC051017 TaxID=3154636 RepID=UPI0034121816